MNVAVIVPFRDRGGDPCRRQNLDRVLMQWWSWIEALATLDGSRPYLFVVDDGRTGSAQFCRSAAYNRGVALSDADIYVFAESDMLIGLQPIRDAIKLATDGLGLAVPFTQQEMLSPTDSEKVRAFRKSPEECTPIPHPYGGHNNYGCINVLSRATLQAVGQFDPLFDGNGHDDAAMWRAFEIAAGPTRFVEGGASHLWHVEGIRPGASLAEKAATERNFRRMQLYMSAKTPEEIRHLTSGAMTLGRDWRGRLRR